MDDEKMKVERVQTGVRLEKRMVKVLKALAEYLDMSLSDLLEGLILHALEGKKASLPPELLEKVGQIKEIYNMDYGAEMAHRMFEEMGEV